MFNCDPLDVEIPVLCGEMGNLIDIGLERRRVVGTGGSFDVGCVGVLALGGLCRVVPVAACCSYIS